MKKEKRAPFKEKPIRYPGQSLDDEISRLRDKIDEIMIIPGGFFLLAFVEWWRWYFKSPVTLSLAIGLSLIALVAFIWVIVRIRGQLRVMRRLALARDGERVVGQYLEELRAKGYRVLHDIVGGDFNIDHVVISPKGIFTIETKTISKPHRGETVINFDGEAPLVNGRKLDRDPMIQSRAQASWIRDFLKSSLGRTFPVRPVVVFPGWFVKGAPSCTDVWVLNEKALPAFIEHEPTLLTAEDLQAITFQLSQYIRGR